MISLVFVTSGYGDLRDPTGRARSIGISKAFTIFGIAEVAGSLRVAFGVLPQLAAFGLILIMFGAIRKRFSLGTQGSGARKVRAGITI
jgi:putative oxidoreductase